jgi:hypothetical protein
MTTNLKALPNELDLVLYAGDGVTIVFSFTQDGAPWPTEGEWSADVRASTVGGVLASFYVTSNESAGTVTISLSGEQVQALGNEAVWDLQQVVSGSEPHTWHRGRIDIVGDVSRG